MARRHGRTACLFVLAGLVALACTAPASAGAANKPYVLTISPGLTAAGQNVRITATFTNLTGPPGGQMLGSANLFWPTSIFGNVTASVPSPATAALGTCTFGTVTGSCIQLRNLSLAPSKSVDVTITPTAPTPVCSTATGSWLVEAKQANNFSGPPGNDLTLSSSSQLTSTLDGACNLAWNAQPAASLTYDPVTAPLNFVTSVPFSPGSPVSVNLVDSAGDLATGSIDGQQDRPTVTLTAASNPGAAVLGGTSAVASGGTAAFGALTINRPGDGYTLLASSGSLTPGLSNAFDVQDKAVSCAVNTTSCSVTDSNGDGSGQVLANPTTTSGTGELSVSINSNNSNILACGSYVSADQNVYEFDGPAGRSKVGTITITNPNPSSPTLTGSATKVLGAQQICFDGPVQFTTAAGALATPDGNGGYIGLLPTCESGDRYDDPDGDADDTTGPCHNRQQDTTRADASSPLGFDIVLVADIPPEPGDPHMR